MAEPANGTTLAPAPIEGEYLISAKEFDPAGKVINLSAPLPTTSDFSKWTVMQQIVMLKKGGWSKSPVNEIVFGLAYAHNLGLDVMRGDVFPTGEGRLGISNKAKIKLAMASGKVEGFEVEMKDTKQPIDLAGCVQKTELECTVTVHVKGWKVPIKRTAKLSRWFKAKNPNWVGNPEHMLELNTLAHALEYISPSAVTDDDEAPPIIAPQLDTKSAADVALENAKAQVEPTPKPEQENK